MAALRRITGQAMVYPIIVVIVAWVMLVLVVTTILPSYGVFELPNQSWLTRIQVSGGAATVLALSVPMAILTLAVVWWRRSAAAGEQSSRWLSWAPGARRTAALSSNANFADLLQLLLSCQAPLPDALRLAAVASGAPSFVAPASELARRVDEGQPLHAQVELLRSFPPLMRTVLLADLPENRLIAGLKRAADNYRDRAAGWLHDIAVFLPVALTFGLAIGVVGVYAVIILQPYYAILNELTHWGVR
jgi:type II secretory pathway component PulF